MNQSNINTNQLVTKNKTFLFFFLLFLMSSIGMFGQDKSNYNEKVLIENTPSFTEGFTSTPIASVASQIEFVGWFMGSKQIQSIQSSFQEATSGSRGITKKQILSYGISPNKVLYRTFMKKVNSQDNAIV